VTRLRAAARWRSVLVLVPFCLLVVFSLVSLHIAWARNAELARSVEIHGIYGDSVEMESALPEFLDTLLPARIGAYFHRVDCFWGTCSLTSFEQLNHLRWLDADVSGRDVTFDSCADLTEISLLNPRSVSVEQCPQLKEVYVLYDTEKPVLNVPENVLVKVERMRSWEELFRISNGAESIDALVVPD